MHQCFKAAIALTIFTSTTLCLADDLSPSTNTPTTFTADPKTETIEPAQQTEGTQFTPKQPLMDRWFDSLVDMRDKTSHHYMAMVHSLDNYFSGGKIEEASNGSYVKLDLQNTFYKSGESDEGISINAKIELPNTEKRFKLIFSSDPEEDKTLAEKIKNNASGQRVEKDSSIAGIEYTPEKTQSAWEHSFTAGVKLRVHPIPFIRYKLGNQWQLTETWNSAFSQSFWNYSDDGIGATTKINFGRPITEKDYFNAETIAEFIDRDNKYYYAETFSNTHRLTETSAIRYWAGVLGESQPTSEITDYLIGVDYRRSLYKDWILLSVKPLLEFPREQDWDATPSLTLDLQIYFSE